MSITLLLVAGAALSFSVCVVNGDKLYDGCGTLPNIACFGSKDNDQSSIEDGCIKDKNCQVLVKVSAPDGKIEKFRWEFAVEYDNSTESNHYCNSLYLMVTKKPVNKKEGHKLPECVPFYAYQETINPHFDHFEPRIVTCSKPKSPEDPRKCQYERITRSQTRSYVRFDPMAPKNFDDSNVNYMFATGRSSQVMRVTCDRLLHEVDLINNRVVLSVFHWFSNGNKSSEWYLGNQVGKNIEPEYLFPKMVLSTIHEENQITKDGIKLEMHESVKKSLETASLVISDTK